jgi:predicted DCC family thiol-disulfide oxidoreductase YuxK
MLTLRMLPLMPLAPVLWFPGMSIPGTRFYNWFARNRYRFSRCEIPVYKEDSQKRED